jgi:hypothetical protein
MVLSLHTVKSRVIEFYRSSLFDWCHYIQLCMGRMNRLSVALEHYKQVICRIMLSFPHFVFDGLLVNVCPLFVLLLT